jgi:hypothetical protein
MQPDIAEIGAEEGLKQAAHARREALAGSAAGLPRAGGDAATCRRCGGGAARSPPQDVGDFVG